MYNFTKEQLVKFYVNLLGYSREEAESCTKEQLRKNLVGGEIPKCAVYNGVKVNCDHIDYDDYFEKCNDCGMSGLDIHNSECIDYEIDEDGMCSHCGTILRQ